MYFVDILSNKFQVSGNNLGFKTSWFYNCKNFENCFQLDCPACPVVYVCSALVTNILHNFWCNYPSMYVQTKAKNYLTSAHAQNPLEHIKPRGVWIISK